MAKVASEAWTLRKAIRSTLDYGNHVLETGKVHSPLNEHKLAAADEAVSEAIHGTFNLVCVYVITAKYLTIRTKIS